MATDTKEKKKAKPKQPAPQMSDAEIDAQLQLPPNLMQGPMPEGLTGLPMGLSGQGYHDAVDAAQTPESMRLRSFLPISSNAPGPMHPEVQGVMDQMATGIRQASGGGGAYGPTVFGTRYQTPPPQGLPEVDPLIFKARGAGEEEMSRFVEPPTREDALQMDSTAGGSGREMSDQELARRTRDGWFVGAPGEKSGADLWLQAEQSGDANAFLGGLDPAARGRAEKNRDYQARATADQGAGRAMQVQNAQRDAMSKRLKGAGAGPIGQVLTESQFGGGMNGLGGAFAEQAILGGQGADRLAEQRRFDAINGMRQQAMDPSTPVGRINAISRLVNRGVPPAEAQKLIESLVPQAGGGLQPASPQGSVPTVPGADGQPGELLPNASNIRGLPPGAERTANIRAYVDRRRMEKARAYHVAQELISKHGVDPIEAQQAVNEIGFTEDAAEPVGVDKFMDDLSGMSFGFSTDPVQLPPRWPFNR